MSKELAMKFKLERVSKNQTIEDASIQSGVSTVTIYKIEKGYEVNLKTLRKYAEHYGRTIKITLE